MIDPTAINAANAADEANLSLEFEKAFELIFSAYNTPGMNFGDSAAWAISLNNKVTTAFTHMQKCRAILQAATSDSPIEFPYQRTFNAIAAATSIMGGDISVSVARFIEVFNAGAPQAPQPEAQSVTERRKIAAEIRAEYLAAVELTPAQIRDGWQQTFSTNNPFCPCDLKTFTKAVRWAEHAVNKAHTK